MQNNTKLPKVVAVIGPTATGKTSISIRLAKLFNGEIVSADSRQVYKGMNLGTGKVLKKEMEGIKHHLLDVASPTKQYTVAKYKNDSEKAVLQVFKNNHLPIICGGTGFYVDALLEGIILPEVKVNLAFRKKLEKLSVEELFAKLIKSDPERAKSIDHHNKVRIIRALEIVQAVGKVPKVKTEKKYDVLYVGIDLPDEVLKEKIYTRLNDRMKKGMLREVVRLHANGMSWKRMSEMGLEYRYLALLAQKKITKEECLKQLEVEIWHYAKRQRTWFKRNQNIEWFKHTDLNKISRKVKTFLKE